MRKSSNSAQKQSISVNNVKKLVDLLVKNELDFLCVGDIKIVKSKNAIPQAPSAKVVSNKPYTKEQRDEWMDSVLFNGGVKQ
jgi:hypothetical protein